MVAVKIHLKTVFRISNQELFWGPWWTWLSGWTESFMTVSALQVGHNLFQVVDLVRFKVGLSNVILQSVHRRHVTIVCVIVYIGHPPLWFSVCLFLCMSACCLAYSLVILSIVTWVYLPFCQHVCLINSLSLHAMDLKQACHTGPGHFFSHSHCRDWDNVLSCLLLRTVPAQKLLRECDFMYSKMILLKSMQVIIYVWL